MLDWPCAFNLPVAHDCGLLSRNCGLLYFTVAYYFRLFGFTCSKSCKLLGVCKECAQNQHPCAGSYDPMTTNERPLKPGHGFGPLAVGAAGALTRSKVPAPKCIKGTCLEPIFSQCHARNCSSRTACSHAALSNRLPSPLLCSDPQGRCRWLRQHRSCHRFGNPGWRSCCSSPNELCSHPCTGG